MLQSKCLRLLRAPPGMLLGQIHKDLGVPLFAYHFGDVTASFDTNLADMVITPSSETRQMPKHTEG